jgi:hypothetical protein
MMPLIDQEEISHRLGIIIFQLQSDHTLRSWFPIKTNETAMEELCITDSNIPAHWSGSERRS